MKQAVSLLFNESAAFSAAKTESGTEKESFSVRFEALLPEISETDLTKKEDRASAEAIEELRLLLDRGHSQRWGLKDYRRSVDIEVRPCLSGAGLFRLTDGRLKWTFRDDPLYKKMDEDFGWAGKGPRACYGPDPCFVEAWRWLNVPESGILHVDLLYLCRYDHDVYTRFPGHPNDILGYMNADRFFFVFLPKGDAPDAAALLEITGRVHLHLHELSRMLMPGFAERDCRGVEGDFCLVFVSGTDDQAQAVARRLRLFGRMLTLPSKTLTVRSLGRDALADFPNREHDICDLLHRVSHPVG